MSVVKALAALAGIAVACLTPRVADAHPLHTTLTEVTVDSSRHTVRAVVRVFIDDLSAGLARQHRGGAIEERATAYIKASFAIVNAGGKAVELRSCGVRRNAELLWVCVEGDAAGDVRAIELRNSVLCDVFPDQVNIVRVGDGKRSRSVLFTRGDKAKRLF